MKILIVAAIAALAAQTAAPPSAAQLAVARRLLDDQLLDYRSARFKDVHGSTTHICGSVNARNRLTAYVGWQSFVVTLGDDPGLYFAEGADAVMVETFCGPETTPKSADLSDRLTHR